MCHQFHPLLKLFVLLLQLSKLCLSIINGGGDDNDDGSDEDDDGDGGDDDKLPDLY